MSWANRKRRPTGCIPKRSLVFSPLRGASPVGRRANSLRELVEPVTSAFAARTLSGLSYGRISRTGTSLADVMGEPKAPPDRMHSKTKSRFLTPAGRQPGGPACKLATRACRTCDLCLRSAHSIGLKLRAHLAVTGGSLADVMGDPKALPDRMHSKTKSRFLTPAGRQPGAPACKPRRCHRRSERSQTRQKLV